MNQNFQNHTASLSPALTVKEVEQRALAAHSAGRLEEAESLFISILRVLPDHVLALHHLGILFIQKSGCAQAVGLLEKAHALAPSDTAIASNLGVSLKILGRREEAIAVYRQALSQQPDDPALLSNLGNVLREDGQLAEALVCCKKAVALKPDYAEAWGNLGVAQKDRGEFMLARDAFVRALELKPSQPTVMCNLGAILCEFGRYDEAATLLQRAISLAPGYAEAHNNLAVAHYGQGNFAQTIASYRETLRLDPNYAEAHSALGATLQEEGKLDEAPQCYRQALSIKPDYLEAHSNLLFCLSVDPHIGTNERLMEARRYGEVLTAKAMPYREWKPAGIHHGKLRVGLVSGDFKTHPVGYFLESLLAIFDPNRIELVAYVTQSREDALTQKLKTYFKEWHSLVGISDQAAAQLIHADGVQILFDLAGHTAHNRLPVFAWKPAPVQASWLGYFATTGVEQMDYLLADVVGVPEQGAEQFTEEIAYLSETRLCFTPPANAPDISPAPIFTNDYITFGCFQSLSKIDDNVLDTWAEIMGRLPDARLRLQNKALGDAEVRARFSERIQQKGIDGTRVTLFGYTARADYLAAYGEVDLLLDTFAYPGGTTTCEALWMGVPTLTLSGNTLLARQGASLLTAAGLEAWIARSIDEYIGKALTLARDRAGLAALRASLRERARTSRLCDAPRFARNLENLLMTFWQRWLDDQARRGETA